MIVHFQLVRGIAFAGRVKFAFIRRVELAFVRRVKLAFASRVEFTFTVASKLCSPVTLNSQLLFVSIFFVFHVGRRPQRNSEFPR